MLKTFAAFLSLTVLAGCSGARKSDGRDGDVNAPRGVSAGVVLPGFPLPGVPLKNDLPAAAEKAVKPEVPATAAAEAPPPEAPAAPAAQAEPAGAAAAASGDLDFHLAAAGKYFSGKKYRSAAAEYGAAVPFLPAGDARAVYLLERQGAMLLRAGNRPKAGEYFLAAINKAEELGTAGNDLANAHLGLGYCLEKDNKIPAAISSYEKALELSTDKTTRDRIANTISDLKQAGK